MPTSDLTQISTIMQLVTATPNIRSILDVGCGLGKYGVLCREYLEYRPNRPLHEWRLQIDAIESFTKYITQLHHHIYDEIYCMHIENATTYLKNKYDLVLAIDVIEHLTKDSCTHFFNWLQSHAVNAIITTPKRFYPQQAMYGNKGERHITHWTRKQIQTKLAMPTVRIAHKTAIIIYAGENTSRIKHHHKTRPLITIADKIKAVTRILTKRKNK